ncbi:helix-turn-helix domain-containing protein [Sphingobium chungbukense]|uniref:hypothetical protein n=1 Tax=Sphingobium chungbukense TaxID=56193 RepID=UPI0012EDBB3B|nr:hypothetical protein [Sphingobium chungbukense]
MTAMFGQRAALLRTADLEAIENDLLRLSEAVRTLTIASQISLVPTEAGLSSPAGTSEEKMLGMLARRLLRESEARQAVLPFDVTVDPAWLMLLDLYAAEAEDKQISVSSACIASGAPHTTALRYLNLLCDKGALVRLQDAADGRRIHVRLTAEYRTRMTQYLMLVAASRE